MTERFEHDLDDVSFEGLSMRNARFDDVDLTGVRMRRTDLSGADMRAMLARGAKFINIDLIDVEITGELQNVTVNGVEIAPLIEAELDRRYPQRAKMRPTTADGFREAWSILEDLWAGTVERARALPEADLHASVDGEWSFIQTLRHLNFATAAWVVRMIDGVESPWHPLDLPWDEAPGWDGIPWDRDVRPSLDEVLAVREERQAAVRAVVAGLTDADVERDVSQIAPGWPRAESFPLRQCLAIVINEEWEHRLYAERDLTALAG